jgi:hypothetical protein
VEKALQFRVTSSSKWIIRNSKKMPSAIYQVKDSRVIYDLGYPD